MSDATTTIAQLKKHIQDFSDARAWRENENAKDLVMALSVESGGINRNFYVASFRYGRYRAQQG